MNGNGAVLPAPSIPIPVGRHRVGRLFFLFYVLCVSVFLATQANAAITYVGKADGGAASGNLVITPPSGSAGDILIATIVARPSGTTIATPSGWTRRSEATQSNDVTMRMVTFYKIASAVSESATTWTFGGTAHTGVAGGIMRFSGVDATNPFDVAEIITASTTSSYTHTASSISPLSAGTLLVTSHSFTTAASWSPPTGMTERVDRASLPVPDTVGITLEMNTEVRAAAGATGSRTATALNQSPNTDVGYGIAHSLVLRPAKVPIAEYRFDECNQYTGAAGEVLDSVGGDHGRPMSGLQNATPGQVQRYADFSNGSRYVNVPSGPVLSDWTISVWFKMPFAGSGTHSSQYYNIGSVSGGGDFLYLDRNSGGGGYRWGVYTVGGSGGTTDGTFRFSSLANGWHHMVIVGQGSTTSLYIDGTYRDQVGRKNAGTFQFLGASYDDAGTANGQSFGTPLDEFKIFDTPLTAAQISNIYNNELAGNNYDGSARANTCLPGLNHLRIEHNGNGVTCTPSTLTIKACTDAACSSYYTGGVAGTLTATGTPTVNWVGGASFSIGLTGVVTKDVQVTTAGTLTWGASGVAPVATNGTSCYIGATNSCSFTSSLAGFLFDVPNHAADASQSISVSAVKQSDNSLACTPAFANASKTIGFGCGYSNPASGTLPVVVGGSNIVCGSTTGVSLNFNASGVASTTVRYADVGQMSLTASYTGSTGSETGLVMTGTDTFIAAPASFSVTPSGPYVAGSAFSVAVAAKNASGNTTPNFGKESTTENVTLGHALVGPAGGNDPALTGTTTIPDASFQSGNGAATVSDIKWAEVGDISITATLASASYLGSGLTATGSAAAGAFKPAYFDTDVTPGTGSFTYSGQPFAVKVTAKNAAGATTLNYKGAYAKAVTLADANSAANNSATLGSFSNASIAAASFNNGEATASTVTYRLTSKTTGPLESPSSAPLKLRATDSDGVSSSGHTEGTTPLRAGRLRLVNFYGSDLLKPRVEYRAEYWNGNRWATNTLDSTTSLVAGNIATGGLSVNALVPLAAGIGFITFNSAAAGSYDIALDLNASGVDTSCNTAHGGTAANKPWLQGYWSAPANCGSVAAWAQDPNARVRLGSPRAPYIYLRERY